MPEDDILNPLSGLFKQLDDGRKANKPTIATIFVAEETVADAKKCVGILRKGMEKLGELRAEHSKLRPDIKPTVSVSGVKGEPGYTADTWKKRQEVEQKIKVASDAIAAAISGDYNYEKLLKLTGGKTSESDDAGSTGDPS